MIVLYVLLAATLLARAAGMTGWLPIMDWHAATRAGLAAMFVFTGTAHFTRVRADMIRMVPPSLPNPEGLVTLTGIAELAGGLALLVQPLSRWAALALIVLLVAIFPANVHAARTSQTVAGRLHPGPAVRAPLQALWMGLLWWSTWTT